MAIAALVLAGCGGGSSSSSGGATSGSSSTAGGTTPGGTAQGVALTDQGTALKLGQAAKVSWQPGGQHAAGVLKINVTKVEKAPISAFGAWQLDAATKKSTPYYVHAKVQNLGKSSLAGVRVPLYLLDDTNTLLQASSFKAQFSPCPSTPLPPKFTHGKKSGVCLVYFVPKHGAMTAVSFRPTPTSQPITWTGPVSKVKQHGKG